ncbi:MAG: LON peptidase substrate-binding domain-containing protein, partial [Bdellovibrionales bacterium]|nr:LON peptidase substrate-binding domain-containing protein [Bdellovibrionales bacterium]
MAKDKKEEDFAVPEQIPVVLSVDIVAFPHVMMSIYVEDSRGIQALDEALEKDIPVLVVAYPFEEGSQTTEDRLYKVGTISKVIKLFNIGEG